MSKKKGLKRGSEQYKREAEIREEKRELEQQMATFYGKVIVDREICIALCRMGWGPGRFRQLDDMLVKVRAEYAEEMLEDYKGDREFIYTKVRMDRELEQHMPKDEGWTTSWEDAFNERRHTAGLRCGPSDNEEDWKK